MTEARVVRAEFVDYKTVRTRSTLQIVLEVPIEQQADIFAKLGYPLPGEHKWVAVALLAESAAIATPDNVRSLNAKRAYADKDEPHRAVNRAGILARDPRFWTWANRQSESTSLCGRTIINEIEAAAFIRDWCGVESRKEFITNPKALAKYHQLETEYRMDTGQMAENRG